MTCRNTSPTRWMMKLRWGHRIPLSVHARHTLDDALTAFGLLDIGKKLFKQTGVFRHEETNSELFFVTLEKSERDYSPSTLYKDYAISPLLFHWESQSGTTQASPTGQRYIHHRERGGHILLFVRTRQEQDGRTMPYTLLGACGPRIAQRRSPNQLCLEVAAGNAGGILPRGKGRDLVSAPRALRPGPLQASQHPLSDALPLELGDRAEDVHLQLAGRRRRVDALGETDERHAERLQVLQQRDQVFQVSAKPIQPPAHDDVEPTAPSVDQELIEHRPPILAARILRRQPLILPAMHAAVTGTRPRPG